MLSLSRLVERTLDFFIFTDLLLTYCVVAA